MALAGTGCSDPALKTDLNTAGPPRVLAVTVQTESANVYIPLFGGNIGETPIFCTDDPKQNIIVCPDGASSKMDAPDAIPVAWGVRVTFSELLNADKAEDLIDTDGDGVMDTGTIKNTKPVKLQCGGTDVAYDGYYDPTGNDYTYPPGPSLIVIASDFVATGTADCELTLTQNLEDKDGNAVDSASTGPYKFGIATLKAIDSDPADGTTGADPTTTIPLVVFNAPVDGTTLAGQFTLSDGTNDLTITPTVDAMDPTAVDLTPAAALTANTTYTVTVLANATIKDIDGGALDNPSDFTFTFMTGTAN